MSAEMMQALRALLQQLEAAQGGAPDPEARARLEQLQQQLGLLEETKERAAQHEALTQHNPAAGGGSSTAAAGSGAATGLDASHDPAAMLQQMDGLARRLSGLEHRLEEMDEGTREVLQQSAGDWLGALQGGAGGEQLGGDLQAVLESGQAGEDGEGASAAAAAAGATEAHPGAAANGSSGAANGSSGGGA